MSVNKQQILGVLKRHTEPNGGSVMIVYGLNSLLDELEGLIIANGGSERDIRKHEMTGYLVDLLKIAVEHVHNTNANDFKKGEIAEALSIFGPAAYGNFPQLRYFGMVAHPEIDGIKQKRRWLVTKTAAAFLRGEYEVRAWVKIKDNHIVERSEERVNIRRLGRSPIQTNFEYYNKDTGEKTGVRPLPAQPSVQVTEPEALKLFDVPEKPAERPRMP